MKRFAIPLVVFALLVIMFGVVLNRNRSPERQFVASTLIDKPAPEFTLPDLQQPGGTVTNASMKGRWYLLNVWGTWCVECRREHGVLLDIQREGKVAVIGLNYQDDDDKARQWLLDLGNPYEAVAVDREGRASIDYGVTGAPETFLVNPQGIIVHKVMGPIMATSQIKTHSWSDIRQKFIDGAQP